MNYHKISYNEINTSMHEFIFRIRNIFQQLLLLRMIQFFFDLNRIYLSDNHRPNHYKSFKQFSSQLWRTLVKDRWLTMFQFYNNKNFHFFIYKIIIMVQYM